MCKTSKQCTLQNFVRALGSGMDDELGPVCRYFPLLCRFPSNGIHPVQNMSLSLTVYLYQLYQTLSDHLKPDAVPVRSLLFEGGLVAGLAAIPPNGRSLQGSHGGYSQTTHFLSDLSEHIGTYEIYEGVTVSPLLCRCV